MLIYISPPEIPWSILKAYPDPESPVLLFKTTPCQMSYEVTYLEH